MNKEEAMKLFDKDKFEELAPYEYSKMYYNGEITIACKDDGEKVVLYFKPKDQYPKVFNNDQYKFEVDKIGGVFIQDQPEGLSFYFSPDISLPCLIKAVDCAKELIRKKEHINHK